MASKGKTQHQRSRSPEGGGHLKARTGKKRYKGEIYTVKGKVRFSSGLVIASRRGTVMADDVAQSLGMSKAQLAETAGLSVETLYRADRAGSAKTQSRLKEVLEIVGRVSDWAGGKDQAMAWYRAEPLPEFGGRTAESLVKDGKAAAVRDYLDHVALGGFA
jgi:hypothetical protein